MAIDQLIQPVSKEAIELPSDVAGASVASDNHPERNEDAFFMMQEPTVLVVLDGMGGYRGGERASNLVREFLINSFRLLPNQLSIDDAQVAVHKALLEANHIIFRDKERAKYSRMGTTASIVYIWQDSMREKKAIIGNVGDSRVYISRNNRLYQITLDDSQMNSALASEKLAWELQDRMNNIINPSKELSEQEQRFFKIRNKISQALNGESISPRINIVELKPQDRLVVCSDGISDNLTLPEMNQILLNNPDNNQAVNKLIIEAQARSRNKDLPRSKTDDMTVIVTTIDAPNTKREVNAQAIKAEQDRQVARIGESKGRIVDLLEKWLFKSKN